VKSRYVPVLVVTGFLLYLATVLLPSKPSSDFNLQLFGQLPVLNGGRIKPLDTIARTSLLMMSGKQTVRTDTRTWSAMEWLTELMFRSEAIGGLPVFEIDDPDVLGVLGIQQTQKRRFSFEELDPKEAEVERQAAQAEQIKPDQRSRFQTAILNLQERLLLYQKLRNTLQTAKSEHVLRMLHAFEAQPSSIEFGRYHFIDRAAEFYPVPLRPTPGSPRPWVTLGRAVLLRIHSDVNSFHPSILAYASLSDAWRDDNPAAFNHDLQRYQNWLLKVVPTDVRRARYESYFNRAAPFYQSLIIYLAVFLIVLASWLIWPKVLQKAAFYLLILAFTVHTAGLVSRMILQGRPPVTNLYSSAIFVGWVAVLLGIVLERLYRNGIGSLTASVIGFITLIIAHHLASTGDTLEMMRAVLDSNFWLATHVVSITVGYGSTFLSGFLAIVYIFRKSLDKGWTPALDKTFERMVYGIVCFSTLFSFVGTILGGVWADQSWGRFWGWDPKENGALMIVLWNVFILHARWGGYADGRRLMLLAVGGNIVTALSWFGVNMLGIGLHSYGFMDKAFVWLVVFIISQLGIMAFEMAWNRTPPEPQKST
jgi:ABC-type transport system involved in cytochrome c biogenesis permease subunit